MNKQLPNNENAREIIAKTKVFLLDLDGTVYVDNELIGAVIDTLSRLRAVGKKIVYLTNNSSRDENEYVTRLKYLGVWNDKDDMYSSGRAAIEYLCREKKGQSVYLAATPEVTKSFCKAGVKLVDDEQPDVAVLAFDTTIDYSKIRKFDRYIKRGAYYVATHPDLVCPAIDESMPDVGSFIAMFKASSGRTPDEIIGKPYIGMGRAVIARYGVQPEEVVMVGDRMSTDMLFAVNNGFNSLLVFSGETTPESYKNSDFSVSLALDSINDIVKYL